MQTFIDSSTNKIYQLDDDVVVSIDKNGINSFKTKHGDALNLPATLVPYKIPAQSLSDLKTQKINELTSLCGQSIVSGFTSSALGSDYHYPSKQTDQQNLTASVLASMLPSVTSSWSTPFWCEDSNGNWAFVDHTAAQIQTVGEDAKTAILTCQSKLEQLKAQVNSATTKTAVNAISW